MHKNVSFFRRRRDEKNIVFKNINRQRVCFTIEA